MSKAGPASPFFSVITICRDNLDGIGRCISSVEAQSLEDCEHVIVDGDSSDGTQEFIEKNKRIEGAFVSEPDNGIYNAINKGIKLARGEVIVLLHSDDMFSLGALTRVHGIFATNDDCDIVLGDALYVNNAGRFEKYKPARFYEHEVVFRGMPAAHEAMFIKRSVYDRIGLYDETYRSAADYKFVSRLLIEGVNVKKTRTVELYKSIGGVSFGGNVEFSENLRLMREHFLSLEEDTFKVLSSLKNYRVISDEELNSIYRIVPDLRCPDWVKTALSRSLIKIHRGDGPEVDVDEDRLNPTYRRASVHSKRVILGIVGIKGVVGGAERVLVTLANGLAGSDWEVMIASSDGKAGVPHYKLNRSVEFLDILEPPNNSYLDSRDDLHSELYEVIGKIPDEILLVVYMCRELREDFLAWQQFAELCRRQSDRKPTDIRNLLIEEVDSWVRKFGGRVRRWRGLLREYRPGAIVAFMISSSSQIYLAARKTKSKVIISNHGNPIRDYLYQDEWDSGMLDRALRFFALFGSAKNHWLSKKFILSIPSKARKNSFIAANPIDINSPRVVARDGGAHNKRILSIGRLVPVKRMDLLISAFGRISNQIKGWQVDIFGDGPARSKLESLIGELGLEDQVFLKGATREIEREFANAEFLVSCSEMEGFGLAVAEGMAAGLPAVIDGDTSGLGELVDDGKTGLHVTEKDKLQGFSKAILRLALDSDLRSRLSVEAAKATPGLSKEAFVRRWLDELG